MLRTLGWILGTLLLMVVCWWAYNRITHRDTIGDGVVVVHTEPQEPKEHTDIDGNTALQPAPAALTVAPQPVPAAAPATTLPISETLAPNAPAGMAFGGSGRFQWYRQGNLTWRIDTRSGATCIAFATMEEWDKPLVYSHGCGRA